MLQKVKRCCIELMTLGVPKITDLTKMLRDAADTLPDNYSLNLNFELTVFDSVRQKAIRLLHTCLTPSQEDFWQASADTFAQKYLVNGEMCTVPEPFCPNCWGEWRCKCNYEKCPHCGYELGKEVKYLLDNDHCPACQAGTVTSDNPVCTDCGYLIEPDKVVWG
jgi:hypothetical protein